MVKAPETKGITLGLEYLRIIYVYIDRDDRGYKGIYMYI